MSRAALLFALFALAACPKKDSAPDAPADVADAEAPAEDLEAEMTQHFGVAVAALSAVIEGDLEASKLAQGQLRDLDTSATPEPWRPMMDNAKAAAAEGAEAEWLIDAARSVAAVGQACGDCHIATGGGPDMTGAPPHPRWGPESEMMRHQWAASLMWLGLTAPSQDSWQAGAAALSSEPLAPDVKVNDTDIARYSSLEEAVHAAASKAQDTTDRGEAAAQYGEIIALCATCHSLVAADKAMNE